MTKAAEKLWILVDSGEGILTRLHMTKDSLNRNKPVFLIDPAYKGVLTALSKKFPEPARIDTVPGHDLLSSNSGKYLESLQVFYEAFTDVMRWKDLAFSCLCEVASNTSALSVVANPFLTYRFLEVVSIYIRLHLFLSTIADRKSVLAVYAKCHELSRNEMAPDFSKLALYVCEYENPFKRILAEFKPISNRIAQALVGLKPILDRVLNLQLLRKDGSLSVTLNPHHLALPASDQFDFDVVLSSKFHDWILFGLLFTPEEYGTQKELMPLTRSVLGQTFIGQIFRDEQMYIHKEYETLFTTYKGAEKELTKMLKKEKKTVGECLNISIGEGARKHRQMRTYVRQELEALICMIEEFPGLIGPKFQMILHALAMARDEIFWFFRHRGTPPPPNATKKYYNEEDYRDPHLILLFDLIVRMKHLIHLNRRIIQTYYLEFLHGQDCKRIKELVGSNFASMSPGKVEMDALQSIIRELESINVRAFMQGTVNYDFHELRLNWYRVEASMSVVNAGVSIVAARDLSLKFHTIIWHSRNVDDIDRMLDEYASLSGLWYHKLALFLEFDSALAACRHPYALSAVFSVLNELPLSANQYNPQDRPAIGEECAQYAEKYVKNMADKVGIGLMMCSDQFINFDHQTDITAAQYHVLTSNGMRATTEPPITPGTESLYKNKMGLIPVRMSLRFIWALCTLMQKHETIVVYDTKFAPREFLRDKIAMLLRMFSRKILTFELNKETQVQKPSILEREFQTFRNIFMVLEHFVDLNIADMIREFWLEEAYNEILAHQVAPENVFSWVGIDATKGLTDSFYGHIINWYATTFQQKILQPTAIGNIIYSETCQSFFSRAGYVFQAQEHFNLVELQAFARLVGPFGCRLLDRELLRILHPFLQQIISHIQGNQTVYEEIEKAIPNVAAIEASVKRIRDLDSLSVNCTFAGTILAFRRLLRRALYITTRNVIPDAVSVTHRAFDQYSRNTLLSAALLPTDSIAEYCGIDPQIVDQPLAHLIKKHTIAEPFVINLMPTVFASLNFSRNVQDSFFMKQYEAHTNNTSVLPFALSQILFTLKSVSSSSPQVELEILALNRKYVEISALIIIHLAKMTPSELRTTKFTSLPSLVAHLDLFFQASPLMTREFLEPLLPYTLVRSMYKELYSIPTPKGW